MHIAAIRKKKKKKETEKKEVSFKGIFWESQMALLLTFTEVRKFIPLLWMECAQVNTGDANSKEARMIIREQWAPSVTMC